MSELSSKEAFSLGCVLPVLVEIIKQDTHLSLWICSQLHYSVLHFYVTSSSLIMVKSFRVDKSWRLQAETRIFQLPLLSSCKHQSEAQCLFCFCYHSCMKKKVHKRAVCWLAVIGRTQRAEWRDSEGRETEFSLEWWKMLFPIQGFFACISPRGGFRSLHRVHPRACVLNLLECSLNIPSSNRFFFFFYLPALAGKIDLEKLGISLENLVWFWIFRVLWKGCSLRPEVCTQ